jgi:hypothetical protein
MGDRRESLILYNLGLTQVSHQKSVVGCSSINSPTTSDWINPANKHTPGSPPLASYRVYRSLIK